MLPRSPAGSPARPWRHRRARPCHQPPAAAPRARQPPPRPDPGSPRARPAGLSPRTRPARGFRASVRLVDAFISPVASASMIASMTGFARRESTGTWGTLVCELRSVNHRFLEAGFRLPDELRSAEGELRARLARQLRRGKVDCTMSYRRPQGNAGALEVNNEALTQLLAAVDAVARSLPEAVSVSALDVLRWPGVLREDGASGEELLGAAAAVFGATLEELSAARAREGA